jgi:[protein-PII] uridylyltransferase
MPRKTPGQLSEEQHLQLQEAACFKTYKAILADRQEALHTAFRGHADIRELIYARASLIDAVLSEAWQHFVPEEQTFACLVAVGGYGRGELHPHSDIDILILLRRVTGLPEDIDIGGFVTFLWDIGLQVGHSVRSIRQCKRQARDDISIATNLMESRCLTGPEQIFESMRRSVGPDKIWADADFFQAKWEEQRLRHGKHANLEYNLEPNIKSSPGGLRDIQTIGWITKRHFAADDISALVPQGFLTEEEFEQLKDGESYLWRVRYALHMISGRGEDRLLFESQREIAAMFGFTDDERGLAVEKFMQVYYRFAMIISGLNSMLIQLFDDAIVRACEAEHVLKINALFRLRNGYIEVANPSVFVNSPSALIEVFTLMARREAIVGVRASTVRLIRQHLHLIDDDFRNDPNNTKRFVELLRCQNKMARQLRRMNRYGVLGRYIPAFGQIVGKMQHDLFHIYTVDAHTLELIRVIRRLLYTDDAQKYPVAAHIARHLPKIELAYIAGLFHDIAKGRGGDHSVLGAVDARQFCHRHGFNDEDSELVAWLVEKHLLMSTVSQRQDITDPDVIYRFAQEVQTQNRLDYLYVLTVADINATNPKLWNSWRASLMRQLYYATKQALRIGLDSQINREEACAHTERAALNKLATKGVTEQQAKAIWGDSCSEYLLRESPNDVAWQTEQIIKHNDENRPLVSIHFGNPLDADDNSAHIFIYTRSIDKLFAVITSALENLELTVQDARIITNERGYTMDTFTVLDAFGADLQEDAERLQQIEQTLRERIEAGPEAAEKWHRRTPRQLKSFAFPTELTIEQDHDRQRSIIQVTAPDRPGLLAQIGQIFSEFNLRVLQAKISTLGERVEDTFFVTDSDGTPLVNDQLRAQLKRTICAQLDANTSDTD